MLRKPREVDAAGARGMNSFFKTKTGIAAKQVAMIVGVSAILALADSVIRSDTALVEKRKAPVTETPLSAAREIQARGDGIFVDARSAALFGAGHIPGALNLDVQGAFASHMTDFWKNVAVDKRVVVYSDASTRELAPDLARKLGEHGYFQSSVLKDGLEGWIKAGGSVLKEKQ